MMPPWIIIVFLDQVAFFPQRLAETAMVERGAADRRDNRQAFVKKRPRRFGASAGSR